MSETVKEICQPTESGSLLTEWDNDYSRQADSENIRYANTFQIPGKDSDQTPAQDSDCPSSGRKYRNGRRVIKGVNDLATCYPAVAATWHPTKNDDLQPSDVLPGSHRPVWWICEHGHEWQAQIKSRVSGSGCPVCANRMVLAGVNDLATINPELARQWHPTKNGDLTPRDVLAGSRRKVWWICEHGHEWQADVSSRNHGTGCPVCAGKKVIPGENDFASQYPELARQWHPTKNGSLRPDQVTPSSNKKVWWICDKGHEYQAVIASRTRRHGGCPYCQNVKVLPGFNDLATKYPKIAAEWHPTKNGDLTPDQVLPGSRRRVWWQCKNGHSWEAVVYSRTGAQNSGCPVCTGYAVGKRRARYAQNFEEMEKRE